MAHGGHQPTVDSELNVSGDAFHHQSEGNSGLNWIRREEWPAAECWTLKEQAAVLAVEAQVPAVELQRSGGVIELFQHEVRGQPEVAAGGDCASQHQAGRQREEQFIPQQIDE